MRQQNRTGSGFERPRKLTRRERFLQEMERIVPWQRLVDVLAPYYPAGERGRPPAGLERMLRVHCLGHWYNLSAPALEEALHDIEAMRRFSMALTTRSRRSSRVTAADGACDMTESDVRYPTRNREEPN